MGEDHIPPLDAPQPKVVPIQGMFSAAVAAELIPMPSKAALLLWLGRHKEEFPARYRRRNSRLERILSEEEILKIRSMILLGYEDLRAGDRFWEKSSRGRGGHPAIKNIIRMFSA